MTSSSPNLGADASAPSPRGLLSEDESIGGGTPRRGGGLSSPLPAIMNFSADAINKLSAESQQIFASSNCLSPEPPCSQRSASPTFLSPSDLVIRRHSSTSADKHLHPASTKVSVRRASGTTMLSLLMGPRNSDATRTPSPTAMSAHNNRSAGSSPIQGLLNFFHCSSQDNLSADRPPSSGGMNRNLRKSQYHHHQSSEELEMLTTDTEPGNRGEDRGHRGAPRRKSNDHSMGGAANGHHMQGLLPRRMSHSSNSLEVQN